MMNLRSHDSFCPLLGKDVYVDPMAAVIGDVHLGDDTSVWPHTVIRGDMHRIRIGQRCSIQDGSVLHITHAGPFNPEGFPLTLGNDVTVGHRVVLHGCTVGSRVLIGIGAIVMDGAVIEDDVVQAALYPQGRHFTAAFSILAALLDKHALSPNKKKLF